MQKDDSQIGNEDFQDVPLKTRNSEDIRIPVIQEEVIVEKKLVETGRVLIAKKIVEETSIINQQLSSEQVKIDRKEINQYVDIAPAAVRQEGDVTIISVLKEVLVVEKKLMLVEEIHITKQKTEVTEHREITLRNEQVDVTRRASGTEI